MDRPPFPPSLFPHHLCFPGNSCASSFPVFTPGPFFLFTPLGFCIFPFGPPFFRWHWFRLFFLLLPLRHSPLSPTMIFSDFLLSAALCPAGLWISFRSKQSCPTKHVRRVLFPFKVLCWLTAMLSVLFSFYHSSFFFPVFFPMHSISSCGIKDLFAVQFNPPTTPPDSQLTCPRFFWPMFLSHYRFRSHLPPFLLAEFVLHTLFRQRLAGFHPFFLIRVLIFSNIGRFFSLRSVPRLVVGLPLNSQRG